MKRSHIPETVHPLLRVISIQKDYWDFHPYVPETCGVSVPVGMREGCLSAFIDTTLDDCVTPDGLVSVEQYPYSEAISHGLVLSNIGLNGVDNGTVTFDIDTITEDEFKKLFYNSTLTIDEGDKRLHLREVNDNTGELCYDYSYVEDNGQRVLSLDGGFFQGFFASGDKCHYKVLPTEVTDGMTLEFVIKPLGGSSTSSCETLNSKHPDNAGIFFYLGTRASDKWMRYYDSKEDYEGTTADGTPIATYEEWVDSDNKFLLFDRSKGGYRVKDWNEDDDVKAKVSVRGTEPPENAFLYYNRNKEGHTARDVVRHGYETGTDDNNKEVYNVVSDLVENALAFRVTDDGQVGYRYMVRDCDEEERYAIIEEYSLKDRAQVALGQWHVIDVRFSVSVDKMRMFFYADGRLVLVSKWLPVLNLRALSDDMSKQEGVPFNISLGGGTQGLSHVVYEDFKVRYDVDTPLERHFAGTFIGLMKAFRFYTCSQSYTSINANVDYEARYLPITRPTIKNFIKN